MASSNNSSLSRSWLRARCCRHGDGLGCSDSNLYGSSIKNNNNDKNKIKRRNNREEFNNDHDNVLGDNDDGDLTVLPGDTHSLLHRIAFTVWHTALHIEREVRIFFYVCGHYCKKEKKNKLNGKPNVKSFHHPCKRKYKIRNN